MLKLVYAMMRAGYLTSKRLSFWGLHRRGLTAIFVIFVVLVSVAPSVRQVHGLTTSANLSEWAIPTGGSSPTGLALDPSGNGFWFAEYSGNKVAQFDPSSNTFKEWTIPTLNARPTGLATTTISGATVVFGVEYNTNKVFVFFPATGTFKEYTLPTANSGPDSISVEPPGAYIRARFSEFGTTGTRNAMGEIVYDVASGTASLYEWTLPAGAGGGPNGIHASAGSIWLAGSNGIVKWDGAANQFTTWPIPAHPSTAAAYLDVDNVGQIWYTSRNPGASSTNNYVGVLRGDNTFKEWQVPTAGADLRVININPLSQSPWVAEQGSSKIGVLDPSAGGSVTSALSTTTPFTPVLGALVTSTTGPVAVATNVVAPSTSANIGSTTNQFTEWTLPGSTPHDVIADSSGNDWILEAGTNKIAKLTLSTPDFGLVASPGTISIPQGGSGTVAITGTSILSFSGPVTLSVTGSIPTGVTFSSFSPNPFTIPAGGPGSATLGITVASGSPTGSVAITVSGINAGLTRTTTFTLTITPLNDFSISLGSSSLTVGPGGSATDTVTITSIGSFNSAVSLSTGPLPSRVHVNFSPSSVTPPSGGTATSTATVSVDAGTSASASTILITGTSGSFTRSQSLSLTIAVTPDFSMSSGPTALSIVKGSSGTSTISVLSVNGFSSAVALSTSWVGAAPTNVNTNLPGPITPPPGVVATSTLTVNPTSSTSAGTYTLRVTGTSGALTHYVDVTVQVNDGTSNSVTTTVTSTAQPVVVTVTQGENKTGFSLTIKNTGEADFHAEARASGTAADWVDPKTVDFGVVAVGQEKTIENAFTMRVPQDAAPGSYTLDWTYYVVDTGQQLLVASYSIQVTQKTSGGLSITGIPGFPIEAILAGLAGGFVAMTLIRRRRSGQ